MPFSSTKLNESVQYLKGVGPKRAELFKKLEGAKEQEGVVQTYDTIISVTRDALKSEGINQVDESEIISKFDHIEAIRSTDRIIDIIKQEDKLIINIVDEGIGIEKSLEDKKDKKQHHHSKGMELTKGRIELVSKMSNKDCSIKGPFQIYDENKAEEKELPEEGFLKEVSPINVFSFHPSTLKMVKGNATHLWKLKKTDPLIKISVDNGNNHSITTTPEHPQINAINLLLC